MDKLLYNLSLFILLFLLIHECVGPPTKHQPPDANSTKTDEKPVSIDDFGLEYNRYLSEVVNVLESDPEFRKKLETAEEADFRNGRIAAELEYVNHHVRTKLDELKRVELDRLRELVRKAEELDRNEVNPNHLNPGHIDHTNPHTFESADLHKLITKVRQDLAEADRKRREEFKEYELQKKFEQEQKIRSLDEEHKKQYLHDLEEQKKKHQKHDPLHHPGSRAQLEEVWEKEDHMTKQKFDPRAFFRLHDINGDGYWDEDELKALFLRELNKLYQAGVPEDDMREREEEMERMREHVFSESDTNGDRLISYEEFLERTKKPEFNRDEGWESIDSQPQYTQEEYEAFERQRQQEIQRLIDQGLLQPHPPGYAPHPAQYQPQYAHGGVPQYHPQQGVHPGQQQQGVHPGQQQQGVHPGQQQQGVHPGMQQQQGVHPGMQQQGVHPGMQQQGVHPGMQQQGVHPGQQQQGVHPGMQQQGVHPRQLQQGVHPGQLQQGVHPGMQQQGVHPGQLQQGVHPGQQQQGVHPGQGMPPSQNHPQYQQLPQAPHYQGVQMPVYQGQQQQGYGGGYNGGGGYQGDSGQRPQQQVYSGGQQVNQSPPSQQHSTSASPPPPSSAQQQNYGQQQQVPAGQQAPAVGSAGQQVPAVGSAGQQAPAVGSAGQSGSPNAIQADPNKIIPSNDIPK